MYADSSLLQQRAQRARREYNALVFKVKKEISDK